MTQTSIKIPSATAGWFLDAWKFTPAGNGPHPVILMAHGFGATKNLGLDEFAKKFAEAGYASIVFDYRHWGGSDGTPRNVLIIDKQLEDYRTVLKFARQQEEFDSTKIILWGSSFSGGHVIYLSAENPGVLATIGQGPFTSGMASALNLPKINLLKVAGYALVGTIKETLGGSPVYIPTAAHPSEFGALNTPDTKPGFDMIAKGADSFPNELNASVFMYVPFYNPINGTAKIKTPILLMVPEADSLCPVGPTLKGIKNAPKGEVVRLPGGHFDVYKGGAGFEKNVAAQIEFLKRVVV